jgi:hypothetical protein
MGALTGGNGIHAGQMRRARLALGIALLLFALVLAALLATGSASAEAPEPPVYDGSQSFPTIADVSYPEAYSWTVTLGAGQRLVQVDEQTAEVQYASGLRAFEITAEPAHDAEGASVPTTLAVVSPDVIELTVHHRAGNPAKGGAPFVYPVSAGFGWEGGSQTTVVKGPPDETELREQREREEAAARPGPAVAVEPAVPHCAVPRLRGLSLVAARRQLRAADCRVGRVSRSGGVSQRGGRVVEQSPKPGRSLGAGTAVDLRLG